MDLLKQYSLINIIQILILTALAIKGITTFFEWSMPRVKKIVYKTDEPRKLKNNIDKNQQQIKDLKASIARLTEKVDALIASDRDGIKAFITWEHHHFCYQKGWIDDYSLDCIERKYTHYVDQGGNSFIQGLMEEIRNLPKQDPTKLTK